MHVEAARGVAWLRSVGSRGEVCSSAMIDPATLTLIGKLIGLGLAVKKGMESDKLDENDVGALKSFLETGSELAKLWSRGKDSRAAALHLALVTRA